MNLLSNQVFQTVLSGVLVFVVGQIIIRFIIEPMQDLKKTIGRISYHLKFYANVYTTTNISPESFYEVNKALRELSCELEADYNAIPLKGVFSFLGAIPRIEQFTESSRYLIGLSNSAGDKEFTTKNAETADKIRLALGIKILSA